MKLRFVFPVIMIVVALVVLSCDTTKIYPTCHLTVVSAEYDDVENEIVCTITHDGNQPDVVYYLHAAAVSISGHTFFNYIPVDLENDTAVISAIDPPLTSPTSINFDTGMTVDVKNSQTSLVFLEPTTYIVPFQFLTPSIECTIP